MEGLASFAANPNVGNYKGVSKTIKANGPKKKKKKKCTKKNPS